MNWDDLRYFLAVARQKTLSAAGKKLGVDSTTVGRRIMRLETSLGSSLFEIAANGHLLTARGEELMRHAEDAERAIMSANVILTGEQSRFSGTVRLSLSEGFARWVLSPNLRDFSELHPEISLEIVTTNGFLSPSKREADIAIMLARPSRGPLIAQKLSDYGLGLYAARSFVGAAGKPEKPEDLHKFPLIGYIPDFIYADELRYLSEIDPALVPQTCSTSINMQRSMCVEGLGFAILPHFMARHDPSILHILPDEIAIRRSFWIVVHRDLRSVGRIKAVIDWLKQIPVMPVK
ncbi:LysR family transcriptional regulator [Parasphingorhabdus sp.]|uniref:LysR family transcriptional regulator n=1 Tax=Parasphingorhabdus sp. TaxID=2709688 RepID=UPI003A8D5535